MRIIIRSAEPYVARGVTWFEYEIEVDGETLEDQASTDDVIEFLRRQEALRSA